MSETMSLEIILNFAADMSRLSSYWYSIFLTFCSSILRLDFKNMLIKTLTWAFRTPSAKLNYISLLSFLLFFVSLKFHENCLKNLFFLFSIILIYACFGSDCATQCLSNHCLKVSNKLTRRNWKGSPQFRDQSFTNDFWFCDLTFEQITFQSLTV